MKYLKLILVLVLAVLVSGCASTKYATSEYDDVYYTKSDATAYTAVNQTTSQRQQTTRPQVSNYNDAYYADDDFYFSRRIRRFNSPTANWRYYDPYFSNDLYFVMGTPAWNTWYNNGWYDWNRPRFGASFGWGNSWGNGWGFNPGFGYNPWNPWGAYSPWNAYTYYNPWTNVYYGNAFNNFGGWNSGFGWNGGLGNPYAYCPPAYYGSGSGIAGSSSSWRQYNEARRASSRSLSSNVSNGNNSGQSVSRQNTSGRNNQLSNATLPDRGNQVDPNTRYLTPRRSTSTYKPGRTGRVAPGSQVGNTTNSIRNTPANSNTRVRPSYRTVPSSGNSRVQPQNNTNRTYTPANTNRRNRNINVTPAPSRRISPPTNNRNIRQTSPPSRINNINRSNGGGGTINRSSGGGTFRPSSSGSINSSRSSVSRPSSTRSISPSRSSGGSIRRN